MENVDLLSSLRCTNNHVWSFSKKSSWYLSFSTLHARTHSMLFRRPFLQAVTSAVALGATLNASRFATVAAGSMATNGVYAIPEVLADGKKITMSEFAGNVLYITNVASQ